MTPEASGVAEQLVALGAVLGATIETQDVASAEAGEALLQDGTVERGRHRHRPADRRRAHGAAPTR